MPVQFKHEHYINNDPTFFSLFNAVWKIYPHRRFTNMDQYILKISYFTNQKAFMDNDQSYVV